MVPHIALVDPELTLTLPPDLTAWSGMDALTQAIECYMSHEANQFSDVLAAQGICLIAHNLEGAVSAAKLSGIFASSQVDSPKSVQTGSAHSELEVIVNGLVERKLTFDVKNSGPFDVYGDRGAYEPPEHESAMCASIAACERSIFPFR
jgi:hypothetical protein